MLVKPLSILLPSDSALLDINQHVLDAKSTFSVMRAQGQYISLFDQMIVYCITDSNRSFTGIVLGVDTSDFNDDTIIHHERTIPSKVGKQASVAKQQGGLSKPIILTTRAVPAISEIMNRYSSQEPLIDLFIDKYGARHQIWPITDSKDLKVIVDAFSEKEKAYIVDGHHRTRAIQELCSDPEVPISVGLSAMFDIEQLDILPFHRIVDIDMPTNSFINELSKVGTLETLNQSKFPDKANEVVIMLEGKYYNFTWATQSSNPIEQLDVNQLSKIILRGILEIKKESISLKVSYIEGNHSVEQIESKIIGTRKAAFLLHPISIDDLIDILNDGHILPPKSTFFLPRMANGIVSMAWK